MLMESRRTSSVLLSKRVGLYVKSWSPLSEMLTTRRLMLSVAMVDVFWVTTASAYSVRSSTNLLHRTGSRLLLVDIIHMAYKHLQSVILLI